MQAVSHAKNLDPVIARLAGWIGGLSCGILRSRVASDWLVPSLKNGGRDRMQNTIYVWLDVHKVTIPSPLRLKGAVVTCAIGVRFRIEPTRSATWRNGLAKHPSLDSATKLGPAATACTVSS
jgi:hypothetical protein